MEQVHLVITGIVQGVGFRYFISLWAKKNNLTGWVQNTPEGNVESLLQGDKQNLEGVVDLCKKGPFLSEVKDLQLKWEKIDKQYFDFTIK
jgi:acylphosphatase